MYQKLNTVRGRCKKLEKFLKEEDDSGDWITEGTGEMNIIFLKTPKL